MRLLKNNQTNNNYLSRSDENTHMEEINFLKNETIWHVSYVTHYDYKNEFAVLVFNEIWLMKYWEYTYW